MSPDTLMLSFILFPVLLSRSALTRSPPSMLFYTFRIFPCSHSVPLRHSHPSVASLPEPSSLNLSSRVHFVLLFPPLLRLCGAGPSAGNLVSPRCCLVRTNVCLECCGGGGCDVRGKGEKERSLKGVVEYREEKWVSLSLKFWKERRRENGEGEGSSELAAGCPVLLVESEYAAHEYPYPSLVCDLNSKHSF